MKYYLYKITNWFNGKVYVGVHKTSDMNDGYMGSGKVLMRAIKKYGLEYFTKEILQVFETQEEMFEAESQVVNEEFVQSEWTYNLKIGGNGGFDYVNTFLTEEKRKVLYKNNGVYHREKLKVDSEYKEKYRRIASDVMSQAHKDGKIKYDTFTGRVHSEESIQKMKDSHKGKHEGEKNSQFGTCWVYHPELKENKKISKKDLDMWLEKGYLKGRNMNF